MKQTTMRIPSVFVFFFVACAALVAGCSHIVDTSLARRNSAESGCSVSTGAYYMPKRLLNAVVTAITQPNDDPQKKLPVRYELAIEPVSQNTADRSQMYCLDFFDSPFSVDHLGVDRTEDGLLRRVFTKADDRSDEVAIQLIEGVGNAVAASRARGFLRSRVDSHVVAEFEFDPLNYDEAEAVNQALLHHGFCIYLDPENDNFVPGWSSELCGIRQNTAAGFKDWRATAENSSYRKPPKDYSKELSPVSNEAQRGILYRPNLAHTLVVLRRNDPTSGDPWVLETRRRIEMPNAAPIFSVQAKRSLFVERQTDLIFDRGVLMDVSIKKPSTLNAFVEIPLTAAQVIVSIPTQILKIRINTANNRKALIDANTALLKTIRDSKDSVQTEAAAQAKAARELTEGGGQLPSEPRTLEQTQLGATNAGSFDFNRCMQRCGFGEIQCRKQCNCEIAFCSASGDALACRNSCAAAIASNQ